MQQVFTIGHSTHTLAHFTSLLKPHGITVVGDVRSRPYSRANPQFNRETLKQNLRQVGIGYVFLGKELGARSEDPSCYVDGKVQYERLAETDLFRQGMDRLRSEINTSRLALMCAEKDPLNCHRTILVARHLFALRMTVQHILADGTLESHAQVLNRLIRQLGLLEKDLFRSRDDVLLDAYKLQGDRIAYVADGSESSAPTGTTAR